MHLNTFSNLSKMCGFDNDSDSSTEVEVYNYFFFCLADVLRQASFIDVILYGFSMSGTLHSDVDADNYVMSYDIPAH